MNEQYWQQAQRLQELRTRTYSALGGGSGSGSGSGGVGRIPITHAESGGSSSSGGEMLGVVHTPNSSIGSSESLRDPLIYPGLYAPSGFDMLGILIRVRTRPNPVIDIGNVDSSVALVLCDSESPDLPIVYCSDPFQSLTGYSSSEILGRNCRFLQHAPANTVELSTEQKSEINRINGIARRELKDRIVKGEEAQVKLVNFRKDGVSFVNLLTVIPILWDDGDVKEKHGKTRKYVVGFQVDAQRGFS
ncbi:White collar 1 protein [Lachnellula suecica]|uniref:White collar 1 protein n=1 Tax=Lachnellula suecica TaxID=602035 RepID=A0A8T9BY50_9HELO|nr:White collar 1 protein [Lachnellula suecica]